MKVSQPVTSSPMRGGKSERSIKLLITTVGGVNRKAKYFFSLVDNRSFLQTFAYPRKYALLTHALLLRFLGGIELGRKVNKIILWHLKELYSQLRYQNYIPSFMIKKLTFLLFYWRILLQFKSFSTFGNQVIFLAEEEG